MAFGKFLDRVRLFEIKEGRNESLEAFLVENCGSLVAQAKRMMGKKCIITDNAFLNEPRDKGIFDLLIKHTHGVNWDSVAVIQTKSEEFFKTLAKKDQQLFRKAVVMAEKYLKNTGYKILTPGNISLDFLSHMATGFEWRNGIIRPIETFNENMMQE